MDLGAVDKLTELDPDLLASEPVGKRRREGSLLRELIGLVLAVGFGLFMLNNLPTFRATGSGIALGTPEPSDPGWTKADATTCSATAEAVALWPGPKYPEVTALGVGITDNVEKARPQAVASAETYLKVAATKKAPGAEQQLAAFATTLSGARAAWAAPITVSDFRKQYQAVGTSVRDLGIQCDAVGKWVQDHVKR